MSSDDGSSGLPDKIVAEANRTTERRQMAIQQLFAPQVEIVSDQVRDAIKGEESIGEVAERLRQAQANISLLIEFAESLEVRDE